MAQDSFNTATSETPTSVGPVTLKFTVWDDGGTNQYAGDYSFEIMDQNGEPMGRRRGNLVPHLTAGQQTAIMNFLDEMLTKAEGVLP